MCVLAVEVEFFAYDQQGQKKRERERAWEKGSFCVHLCVIVAVEDQSSGQVHVTDTQVHVFLFRVTSEGKKETIDEGCDLVQTGEGIIQNEM